MNARGVALTEAVAVKQGFATAKPATAIAACQFPRLAVQVVVTRHPSQSLLKRPKALAPADVVPNSDL